MYSIKPQVLFLTSLLWLLISGNAFSQGVQWGKVQISPSKLYTPYIMGDDENYFYSTSTVDDKIYLEKFSKNDMSRLFSRLIERPKIDKKELTYEGIYFLKDKFVIFASYYNNAESSMNIYAYVYDAESGNKADDPRMIMTVDVDKQKRKGNFYVFISMDRTRILVNHMGYYRKEKCWKDKYLLLSDLLEPITEREDKIFKDEVDFSTFNYIIDNDGSFYYIKTMENKESFIVSYDANKDYEKWESHIDLSDVDRKTKVRNLHFNINAGNDLILAGYYTLDGKYLAGTFVMKIKTESKEIVYKKVNTFEKEVLKRIVASNALKIMNKKNPQVLVDYYNSTELLAKSDGGIVLIGESAMYAGPNMMLYDILVVNHNADGELLWAQKVPKFQVHNVSNSYKSMKLVFKEREYVSYFPVIQGDKLSLYLNDRRTYASKSREQMLNAGMIKGCNLKKISKAVPVCYSFNLASGDLSKSVFQLKLTDKVYLKPIISYQKQYNRDAVFFTQYGNRYRFGLLKN